MIIFNFCIFIIVCFSRFFYFNSHQFKNIYFCSSTGGTIVTYFSSSSGVLV